MSGGLTPNKIVQLLEQHKQDLRRFGVKKIGLFGSYLKKQHSESSDIDFLVEFSEPSFDNYMNLKFFLEELFGKKIDLVTEQALKPAFRYIKKEAHYVAAV